VDSTLRYRTYRRVYERLPGKPRDGGAPPLDKATTRRMLAFTWQVTLLAAVSAVVWDRSEFLFLERFSPVRELAFYSLGFSIVQQLLTVPQVFASAPGANLFVEQGRDPSALGRVASVVVRYVALVALPLTLGLAALSPSLVLLVYGQSYAATGPVLRILALGATVTAFLTSAQHLLMATERQGFLLRWTVVIGIVNLSLDFLLVPRAGAIGAALGNATSQAVAVIGMWVYLERWGGFRLPWTSVARTALAAAGAAAAAGACGVLLPGVPGVLAGIAAGAASYLTLVRVARILDPLDQDRLLGLGRLFPAPVRPLFSRIVRLVTA
jgi:O-antigen/teichoic acid export membrane protein